MKLVVSGCGSGGTNLGIELVRSFKHFHMLGTASSSEHRIFFKKLFKNKLSGACATKLATENEVVTKSTLLKAFDGYPGFRVVFMFRNPVDVCLSKIARANTLFEMATSMQIPESGLECSPKLGKKIPDHTIVGATATVKNMYDIYFACKSKHPDKIYEIKMEELITDRMKIRKELSEWLSIEYDGEDPKFWLTTKKQAHRARYGDKLVMNVNLYKNLKSSYEGRFMEFQNEIDKIALCFEEEMRFMKYEY